MVKEAQYYLANINELIPMQEHTQIRKLLKSHQV